MEAFRISQVKSGAPPPLWGLEKYRYPPTYNILITPLYVFYGLIWAISVFYLMINICLSGPPLEDCQNLGVPPPTNCKIWASPQKPLPVMFYERSLTEHNKTCFGHLKTCDCVLSYPHQLNGGFQALSSMAVCNQSDSGMHALSTCTWLHQMGVSRLFLPRLYVISQTVICMHSVYTWLHQMAVSRLFLPWLYVIS